MRLFKFFILSLVLMSITSCGGDDDICISGEATPRMKIKFKTQSTGKMKTLESLFIRVDYGNGPISVVSNSYKTDSVSIPLRVDNSPFTAIYVGLSDKTVNSEVKINYTTSSQYVSPACGIKKSYQNVSSKLEKPGEVVAVEQNQNQINDESKTHLFLLF